MKEVKLNKNFPVVQSDGSVKGYKIKSFDHIYRNNKQSKVRYWFAGILMFFVVILFLPWTQNIKAKGTITSLYQEQRPQDINSPIPG